MKTCLVACLWVALLACDSGSILQDAGEDAMTQEDAGEDAGQDAGEDAGEDAGIDAGEDAGEDAGGGDPGLPLCGEIVTFETDKTPMQEIHVATEGNDGTGDGSSGSPYASLGRALQDVQPGSAVRLHAGTYAGGMSVENLAGTAEAPIWIGGAPGEAKPLIEGGNGAIQLSRVRYLVLHDLEARGQSQNGINCDDGGDVDDPEATRFVVFRGLDIHDVGGTGNEDCLKLSGVNDFFVLDSFFARCGGDMSGSGVDCVGCHRALVARCRFEQNSGNAVQAKGGTTDMEIRGCTMIDPGERGVNLGGSTGDAYFRPPLSETEPNAEARRILVVNNLIVDATAAVAFVGCVDCLAANNTIVNPENWVARILQETSSDETYIFEPASRGRFINNLVWFDSSQLRTFINVGSDTAPETFTFANNLWYAHDAPGASTPSLPVTESDGVIGQNPMFSAEAAGEYQPESGSPACGAGLSLEEVLDDLALNCRAAIPAIGALECL